MSTIIIITPPPKNPTLTQDAYDRHMQAAAERLQRDIRALEKAGFTVDVQYPAPEAVKADDKKDDKKP